MEQECDALQKTRHEERCMTESGRNHVQGSLSSARVVQGHERQLRTPGKAAQVRVRATDIHREGALDLGEDALPPKDNLSQTRAS